MKNGAKTQFFCCINFYFSDYIKHKNVANDSFFENVLLKNIKEDIPINVDLSDTPEKKSVSTIRKLTISKTERYIDKVYDETVKSELKKEILL